MLAGHEERSKKRLLTYLVPLRHYVCTTRRHRPVNCSASISQYATGVFNRLWFCWEATRDHSSIFIYVIGSCPWPITMEYLLVTSKAPDLLTLMAIITYLISRSPLSLLVITGHLVCARSFHTVTHITIVVIQAGTHCLRISDDRGPLLSGHWSYSLQGIPHAGGIRVMKNLLELLITAITLWPPRHILVRRSSY